MDASDASDRVLRDRDRSAPRGQLVQAKQIDLIDRIYSMNSTRQIEMGWIETH